MKTLLKKSVIDMSQVETFTKRNEVIIVAASGSYVLNMSNGPTYQLNLIGNTTIVMGTKFPAVNNQSFSFMKVLISFKQDAVGSRTVTWPASFVWTTPTPPAISTSPNSVTNVEIITFDGGSTWFCRKM